MTSPDKIDPSSIMAVNETEVAKGKDTIEEETSEDMEERMVVTDEDDDEDYDEEEEEDEEELTSEEITSLLNLAVENDRVDIVKEMLQQYPDYLNGNDDSTPLHICIQNKSIQCLNCLLRMGADPSKKNSNNETAYGVIKGDVMMIDQAFFMELVRVMNVGDVHRIEELLNCGYKPDSSILDWIPDGLDKQLEDQIHSLFDKFHVMKPQSSHSDDNHATQQQPEQKVEEPPQPPPQTAIIKNTCKISELKQEIEEKSQLEKQLSRNLEDMIQMVTISQSLILSGSSALVTHVKKLKANKLQKEIELEQYTSIIHDLKLQCQNSSILENNNQTNDTDNTTEEEIEKLTQELNIKQTKINKIKSSILDLSEENSRIAKQIQDLGLAGALTFTKNLYDDVRSLDLLICNAQAEESILRSRLGLNNNIIDVNNGVNDSKEVVNDSKEDDNEVMNDDASRDTLEDDDEYEEDSEDEQSDEDSNNENTTSYTNNILKGKSKAIVVRNSNPSLDIWDIIRRLIGRVVIVSSSSVSNRRKKNDNKFTASGNVMII